MFSSDEILILGDSFCAWRDHDNDWPVLLTAMLTESNFPCRGKGFSGAAWWSVRQELLKELDIKTPKILILCHTHHNRIPSSDDLPLNFNRTLSSVWSEELIVKFGRLELEALTTSITGYYTHLYIYDFHRWCQLQWFKELDEILDDSKIEKVIHLHCINRNEDFRPYKFRNGITSDKFLSELIAQTGRDFENRESNDIIRNHFTILENKSVAHSLYHAIINYKEDTTDLNLFGHVNGIS
jgi:hypothetical protein